MNGGLLSGERLLTMRKLCRRWVAGGDDGGELAGRVAVHDVPVREHSE